MPVRLVAIDIDGTLLDSRWQLPEANRTAILRAHARGVHVVLVTGRRFDVAKPVLDLVPEVATIIVSGGAVTKSSRGTTISRQPLACDVARRIIDATRAFRSDVGVVFDRSGPNQVMFEEIAWTDPRRRFYFEFNRDAIGEVTPLEACLTEDPIQVMAAAGVERVRAIVGALEAMPQPRGFEIALTEYPSRDLSILDVTADGVSKGSALAALARLLGIDRTDVMALGDNLNDRTMLEFAGVPVVMGNASTQLKRFGWLETGSNDDAGVAQAIEIHALDRRAPQ